MSARRQQVELVRPVWRNGPGNHEIRSDVHLVTWVDSSDAVLGKEVSNNGSRWIVEKVYSTVQEL